MVEDKALSSLSPKSQNFYTNIETFTAIGGVAGGAVTAADVTVVVTTGDVVKKSAVSRSKAITNYTDFLKVEGWTSEYRSVDLLLRHLSRKCRSEASRRAYLRQVYSLCVSTNIAPDELVKLPKRKVEKLVQEYVDKYNNDKYSRRYVNNIRDLLKTFFRVNDFKGSRALDIEGCYVPSRYRKVPEYIPEKHEIYLMADSTCSLRDRAIILTLYSTGIRNSTLRALLIRDVENELSKNIDNILIPVYPEMKQIDPYACKGNIPYYTFTCNEATQAIKLYLQERKEKYGEMLSYEPLFISNYNQIDREERKSKIMSPRQLQQVVKMAARRADLAGWEHVSPKCLRKACETILHSERLDGSRLSEKIQEFFMGHILPGSQDTYFDQTKVEKLRAEYAKLNFGRVIVENKFKVLRMAVARAFEGTGINPDKVIEEYVDMQRRENCQN